MLMSSGPLFILAVFLVMIVLLAGAVLVAAAAQAVVNRLRGQHGPQQNATT